MEQQTLATALDAARDRQLALEPNTPDATGFLLVALQHSTTCREQIVQRRIGQQHSHVTVLK